MLILSNSFPSVYNGRKSIRTSGWNLKYLLYRYTYYPDTNLLKESHFPFPFRFLGFSCFRTKKIQWKRYFTIRTSGWNPQYLLAYYIISVLAQKLQNYELQNDKLQKRFQKLQKFCPFLRDFSHFDPCRM